MSGAFLFTLEVSASQSSCSGIIGLSEIELRIKEVYLSFDDAYEYSGRYIIMGSILAIHFFEEGGIESIKPFKIAGGKLERIIMEPVIHMHF